MISKEKIKNTVVCYWSAENESFVADSALIPHVVIGVGDTPEEAMQTFESALEDAHEEFTSDNVAGYKMGRPAKGYVPLNVNIRPSSKIAVANLAKELDISQGEAIDYLVFFRDCKIQEMPKAPDRDEILEAIDGLSVKINLLSSPPGHYVSGPFAQVTDDPRAIWTNDLSSVLIQWFTTYPEPQQTFNAPTGSLQGSPGLSLIYGGLSYGVQAGISDMPKSRTAKGR